MIHKTILLLAGSIIVTSGCETEPSRVNDLDHISAETQAEIDEAKMRTAKIRLENFETAIKIYRLRTGNIPPSIDALVADRRLFEDGTTEDPWGNKFDYQVIDNPALGISIEIRSAGPDGRTDTPDDLLLKQSIEKRP